MTVRHRATQPNRLRARFTPVACALVSMLLVSGASLAAEEELDAAARPSLSVGLQFNYDGSLLDITEPGGGIGLVAEAGDVTHRLTADLLLGFSSRAYYAEVRYRWLRRLSDAVVRPYVGGGGGLSYGLVTTPLPGDDRSTTHIISASVAGTLGVEVRLADFVALFAEYDVRLLVEPTVVQTQIAGSVETTTTVATAVDLGLGNGARVGIVVFGWKVERRGREDGGSADDADAPSGAEPDGED